MKIKKMELKSWGLGSKKEIKVIYLISKIHLINRIQNKNKLNQYSKKLKKSFKNKNQAKKIPFLVLFLI